MQRVTWRHRARRAIALSGVLVLGATGCRRTIRAPADEPLRAEVSGCAALVIESPGRPPACVLPRDRRVRFHVPSEPGERIDVDVGVATDAGSGASRRVAGGQLVELTVPEGSTRIAVRRTASNGTRASYDIDVARSATPAWFELAESLRKSGDLDGAAARARAALAGPDALDHALAAGVLARVALRRGHTDEADRLFRAAIAGHDRIGRISNRADDAFALAFMLHQRARRYADARRVLDELSSSLDAYPDGRARFSLYRGQIAWEAGDTRAALRDLASAVELADRLGAAGIARAARQVRGMVLCNAGSARTCLATLREEERLLAEAEGVTACERAEIAAALGFAELSDAESSETSPAGLGDADARALAQLEGGCPDAYLRAIALEHLALAAVMKKDAALARERLAQARAAAPEPRASDALFWLDVDGKIALLEGRIEAALESFEAERALAQASKRDAEAWRALVGRGATLEAAGRRAEALEAYRAAEDVLDEATLATPFGEGRGTISTESARSMRRAISILLLERRDADALDVARRARSRLARSLARAEQVAALTGAGRERWERAVAAYRRARDELDAEAASDWKKARPALEAALAERSARHAALRAALDDAMALVGGRADAAPGPHELTPALPRDELVLAYVTLAGHEVLGFASENGRTRAARLGPIEPGATKDVDLAGALLGPFRAELERARRVRVLHDGALAAVDVHALPFGGAPLVARVPVVYGLDLGETGASAARRTALVVADPTSDLPAAREEGRAAANVLGRAYLTRTLAGREATAARVRQELGDAALLHYAGHGVFGGREGAESRLPLALGGSLALGDVFALERAPRFVVLSGCEAGRAIGDGAESAAGMAHAFLVAGAKTVIAPVRVVDDRAAGALVRDLATELVASAEPDLAFALHAAQARAIAEGRPGWDAFRAFAR